MHISHPTWVEFFTVAIENEKLKEELKYADVKSLKERHSKLVIYTFIHTYIHSYIHTYINPYIHIYIYIYIYI